MWPWTAGVQGNQLEMTPMSSGAKWENTNIIEKISAEEMQDKENVPHWNPSRNKYGFHRDCTGEQP